MSIVMLYDLNKSTQDSIIINLKHQKDNLERVDQHNQEIILKLDNEVKRQKKFRNIAGGIGILLLILLIAK